MYMNTKDFRKIFNTLLVCLEIILPITIIIIFRIYSFISTNYLWLLIVFGIGILEIIRRLFFGEYVISKEEIYLPMDVCLETIKEKISNNENYILKNSNISWCKIFVEKSLNNLEFVFIKSVCYDNSNGNDLDKLIKKYKNEINNDCKKFHKIYIIVECDNYYDSLYENIFNKIYLKPIYLNRMGFDNNLGSFVIPVIYDKSNNKLCFGSCKSYPSFFYNKKEEFISAIEYLIYENK